MAQVKLENVSVRFPIYNQFGRSLKSHVLMTATGGRLSRDRGTVVVDALHEVNLTAKAGDRYALLGHNGAGKTTLLKVLAGIYNPTAGSITIDGTVASLFSSMVGFDRDRSGLENVEVTARLMGLKRQQIREIKEEVAEESGLGEYLNLPIRTYSSGMLTRLAFCLAMRHDSDIFLIDESVITGDARFVGRSMERVTRTIDDTPILFLASHSPDLLRRFCNKGLLFNAGHVEKFDTVEELLRAYQRGVDQSKAAG
ncbi:ATP-binding cassette domain-containing protein [Gammaproteobacteria bacterium]|nr:ATP-binding cassette domain-containing protein [Gammaproteobacteria bacterium]